MEMNRKWTFFDILLSYKVPREHKTCFVGTHVIFIFISMPIAGIDNILYMRVDNVAMCIGKLENWLIAVFDRFKSLAVPAAPMFNSTEFYPLFIMKNLISIHNTEASVSIVCVHVMHSPAVE